MYLTPFLLTSLDPNDPNTVAATSIGPTAGSYAVTFDFGEGNDSILRGLTIINKGILCYIASSPIIEKNTIRNCSGPGISLQSASGPLIRDNTIENNNAGGIEGSSSNLIVERCTITGNSGGIHGNGNFTISGSTISNNTASSDGGGGIYCSGTLTISASTISNNTVASGYGGGIYYSGSGSLTISGSTISNNTASSDGGGIYCSGSTISNNTASGYGGGICYYGSGSLTISGSTISNNTASGYGGGIYRANYSSGTISNCIISGNKAETTNVNCGGGGIYGSITVANCLISGNGAYYGGGVSNCSSPIRNCTIIGNWASFSGGGLSNCNSVKNNVIAFNRAGSGGGISGSSQNSYNTFWSNTGGNFAYGAYGKIGDFYADPRFASNGYWDDRGTPGDTNDDVWVEGDYHLKSAGGRWTPTGWVLDALSSLCIDAGDPADAVGNEPAPNGGRINIGNYGGTAWASKTPGQGGGPMTFPGLVQNLSAGGGHKQIILTWDEPGDNGGTAITGYRIYRGLSAGTLALRSEVGGGELTFADGEVAKGTTYYYAVAAVNGFGQGAQAGPVSYGAVWNDMDFNGDGLVNIEDLAVFAAEWLWQAEWQGGK